eukprot:4805470-Pyramimonas_sp.AAC.1
MLSNSADMEVGAGAGGVPGRPGGAAPGGVASLGGTPGGADISAASDSVAAACVSPVSSSIPSWSALSMPPPRLSARYTIDSFATL